MRPAGYVWGGFSGALIAFLVIALIFWPLLGGTAALAVFSLQLGALFLYHIRCLKKLVLWSREPIGAPLPQAFGVWDYVYADLARRARVSLDQRDRLAQALARFREATTAMPSGVILLSAEHFIEWINPAAAQHFGLEGARDVGKPLTNLVRQPDFVAYLTGTRTAEPLTCRLSRQAGTVLSIQIVPFGEDQSMVLSRDVTQFEKLETMRRDFVANVSHELKTPLTVVSGFLETLDDLIDELPPEDVRRYLHLASEQADRMQHLVEDLLQLAALETSAAASYDETVQMASLLNTILEEGRALSSGRHEITLDFDGPANLRGSRKEIHSAMLNLVSNAVRYTPAGGRIDLRWNVAAGGGARFAVTDTGLGIEPQHIPRLTERFYRVDRGRSRESGGTGLGLAIVKHALSRHQATLQIESRPGHGSTFAAAFPAERIARPTDA
ncbi:phosphate regulon sensor histidine kinase PhoR [Niveibacterium umoris]|uniref:Phosphate regulon sensor protein PhoR n=1 Tax=Niveibacterium umoris TaxID=1193620 RepID=A0A840BMU1_9RHOO|nr:phosphate regulon sensor histidine kinase PhoR [Niveibacterium umoris]MBB4013854.1 two-component system phosphate regulon sensor histidine kinase PhoR [Niveibacterium umoris]